MGVWTSFIRLRTGSSCGSCEHVNGSSGFINGTEFIQVSDYKFLKNESAIWRESESTSVN
jgi:hypothetical protein